MWASREARGCTAECYGSVHRGRGQPQQLSSRAMTEPEENETEVSPARAPSWSPPALSSSTSARTTSGRPATSRAPPTSCSRRCPSRADELDRDRPVVFSLPQRQPLVVGDLRLPRGRLRGLQPRRRPAGVGRGRQPRSSRPTARSPVLAPTTAEPMATGDHPAAPNGPGDRRRDRSLRRSTEEERTARLDRPARPQARHPLLRRRRGGHPRPRRGDRRDRARDRRPRQLGGQGRPDPRREPGRGPLGAGGRGRRPPRTTSTRSTGASPISRASSSGLSSGDADVESSDLGARGRHRGPARADLRPRTRSGRLRRHLPRPRRTATASAAPRRATTERRSVPADVRKRL